MAGFKAQIFNRRIGFIALITGAHVVALWGLLSLRPVPPLYQAPPALEIELATLPPEPIAPPPEPEPTPVREPAPVSTPTPEPAPPSAPEAAPATSEPSTPNVLTQLGEAAPNDLSAVAAPPVALADAPLTMGQIQHVLKQAECQKLTRQRDPDCAPEDPFEIALASAARQAQPPEGAPDSPFATISDYDRLSYQTGASTFGSLGMSGDLFVDPMPDGAYTAQRIRNGREPIWSNEMKDSFRKRE